MSATVALTRRIRPVVRSWWRRFMRWRAADITDTLHDRRFVVVAPHPDDETIGCGGLVARLAEAGSAVDVMVVTDGRRSHPSSSISGDDLARIRSAECRSACSRLGLPANRLHLLAVEEGELASRADELVQVLGDLVDRCDATDLLVPCAFDWHGDHVLVHRAATIAARSRPMVRILEYPVWFWADGPWLVRHGASLPRRAWSFVTDPVRTLFALRPVVVRSDERHRDSKRAAMDEYRSQTSNITGEVGWAVLDESFLDDFLGADEVFFVRRGVTA